jgi:selenocysteine lyase/cysteine desulfurase
VTPPGPQAGLTTFRLEGYDPARVMLALEEEGIVLRYVGQPYALRVSTGFFNDESDIERLLDALERITQRDPETLPQQDPK